MMIRVHVWGESSGEESVNGPKQRILKSNALEIEDNEYFLNKSGGDAASKHRNSKTPKHYFGVMMLIYHFFYLKKS